MKLFVIFLLFAIITSANTEVKAVAKIVDRVVKYDILNKFSNSFFFRAAPVLGLGLEVFSFVKNLFNPIEPPEKGLARKLDEILSKFSAITSSITSLKDEMILEFSKQSINSKMKEFRNFLVSVDAFEFKIKKYYRSFNDTKSPKLLGLLTELIKDSEKESLEFKIVKLFDANLTLSQSIVEEITNYARLRNNNFFTAIPSSTSKIVQDFYLDVLRRILKSFAYRELAISMKYANSTDVEGKSQDFLLLSNGKEEVLQMFTDSLRNATARLADNDFKAYYRFKPSGNVALVNFRSMFQTFIVEEPDLSEYNSCKKTCQDYKNVIFNSQGCIGQAKNCYTNWKGGSSVMSAYLQTQSPFSDRIYYSYKYGYKFQEGEWKGLYGGKKAWWMKNVYKQGIDRPFFHCDVCVCTCDQNRNSNTVRRIYVGKLEAPEGYVVTGVRFIMIYSAIALQTQTAKLLPLAAVDKNTLKWQDIPKNRNHTIFAFGNPFTLDLTESLKFDANETVVTGIQLFDENRVVKLKIFGRSITNITEGTLSSDEVTVTGSTSSNDIKTGGQLGVEKDGIKFTVKNSGKLEFRISDDLTDAGQSFVPFFDAHSVSFLTPAPITSVGLIHYTNNENFAGYVKPSIRSVDWSTFFND